MRLSYFLKTKSSKIKFFSKHRSLLTSVRFITLIHIVYISLTTFVFYLILFHFFSSEEFGEGPYESGRVQNLQQASEPLPLLSCTAESHWLLQLFLLLLTRLVCIEEGHFVQRHQLKYIHICLAAVVSRSVSPIFTFFPSFSFLSFLLLNLATWWLGLQFYCWDEIRNWFSWTPAVADVSLVATFTLSLWIQSTKHNTHAVV